MNKDQAKGAAKEAAGKLRKNVGKATANGTEQIKGAATELAGKVQKSYGNMKSDVKREMRSTKRDRSIDRHAH